jgi:hypothetical protein
LSAVHSDQSGTSTSMSKSSPKWVMVRDWRQLISWYKLKRVRWLPVIKLNIRCPRCPHATAAAIPRRNLVERVTHARPAAGRPSPAGAGYLGTPSSDSGERSRVYAHTADPVPGLARSGDMSVENLVR